MGCSKSSSKRNFIAIQSYLKKQEASQINNLTLHLKQIEKEEQKTPKASRRKEIRKGQQNKMAKDTGSEFTPRLYHLPSVSSWPSD